MTTLRLQTAKKRRAPAPDSAPQFWLPAPGTLVGAHKSGFEALTTGELKTGDRHEFEIRSAAGPVRLAGVVVWRRLHDLPATGGRVRPRFEIGVEVEGVMPAALLPAAVRSLEMAA